MPASRLFAPELLTRTSTSPAKLTLTRDSCYTGSATGIDVFLDGRRFARIAAGESITIFCSPGQHLIGARYSWGPVAPAEKEFTFSADVPKSARVTIDQAAIWMLSRRVGYFDIRRSNQSMQADAGPLYYPALT